MTHTGERQVIVSYHWDGNVARLRCRPVDGASALVEAQGFRLEYQVADQPVWHCPGHRPFRSDRGQYVDCLNRPQPGGRRCVSCAVAEATLAGSLHHAHLRSADDIDGDVQAHLRQPNVLYLAVFGDGSIKVGTSTSTRIDGRLTEQGALVASVVARADDGIVVRHAEDLVTTAVGLPQSVGNGRKLRGLVTPRPADLLERALAEAVDTVHRLLSDAQTDGLRPERQPWTNPRLETLYGEKLFGYPADLRRDAHQLTVDYMIGRLAIVEGRGGDRFVVDIGTIFGLELEPGVFDPVEITVQDTLF